MPISLYNSSQANNGNVSSISWVHPGPSTPGLYDMVMVVTGIFGGYVPAVSYGGNAMAQITIAANDSLRAFFWRNPPAGNQTVVVSIGPTTTYMHAVCLYFQSIQAEPTYPFPTSASNSVTYGDTGNNRTLSASANVDAYHYVVSAVQWSNGTYVGVSGASHIISSGTRLHVAGALNDDTPDTPRTVTWTYNNQPDTYRMFIVSIKQQVLGAQFKVSMIGL